MSTRWNFKNNAERYENYKELDTNPSHYKSKYDRPYTPILFIWSAGVFAD